MGQEQEHRRMASRTILWVIERLFLLIYFRDSMRLKDFCYGYNSCTIQICFRNRLIDHVYPSGFFNVRPTINLRSSTSIKVVMHDGLM